jgi:hypothetical protein
MTLENPFKTLFGKRELPKGFTTFAEAFGIKAEPVKEQEVFEPFLPKGQFDPELLLAIQKYGCYYLAFLERCYVKYPKIIPYTAEKINELYKVLVASKALSSDCLMSSPTEIMKYLEIPGGRQRVYNDSVAFPVSYVCKEDEFEILNYERSVPHTLHFCSGDGQGRLVWDPIVTGSNTVKYGKIISKRIFKY